MSDESSQTSVPLVGVVGVDLKALTNKWKHFLQTVQTAEDYQNLSTEEKKLFVSARTLLAPSYRFSWEESQ